MDIYNKPSPEEFLEHHGIKGQKWGVRRYQNEDGSYTEAGMKRYRRAEEGKKLFERSGMEYSEATVKLARRQNKTKTLLNQAAVAAGATAASVCLRGVFRNSPAASISASLIAAGANAVNIGLWAKASANDKRLKAYADVEREKSR